MINVNCPLCNSGEAEIDDVEPNLDYISIKCFSCKKISACGVRDWEIDGEQDL